MAKDDSPNVNALKSFMRQYNMWRERTPVKRITDELWQTFGNEVLTAAYTQYFDNANSFRGIRPSNAYKPAITHVLQKFGYALPSHAIKWNRSFAPFVGHVTESLMKLLLIESGVAYQHGVNVNVLNGAMSGTLDLLVDNAVVDIKSMNGYYFKAFTECPNDERGYITQLHLYADAVNSREMYALCICKDYPSAALVQIGYNAECLDSVKRRIDILNTALTVEDIRRCPVPALVKGRSGKLTVPPQLRYCESKALLYKLTDPDSEFCNDAYGANSHDEILAQLIQEHVDEDLSAFDDVADLPYDVNNDDTPY
jgi:hypothetical protein